MVEVNVRITDLERVKPLLAAVEAVTRKWQDMHRCYSSTEEAVELAELLDTLATAVAGLSDGARGEGEGT